MANNQGEGLSDDFFEQILQVPGYPTNNGNEPTGFLSGGGFGGGLSSSSSSSSVMLGLGTTGDGSRHHHHHHHHHGLDVCPGVGIGSSDAFRGGNDVFRGGGDAFRGLLPLGLNLDHGTGGFLRTDDIDCKRFGDGTGGVGVGANASSSSSSPRINEEDHHKMQLTSLFPAPFGQLQPHSHSLRPAPPLPPSIQLHQSFQVHSAPQPSPPATSQHPPGIRPRVRARRGQATDPHSIAERLRRERIAERMKALQELVPSCNKTDRAAMLDEIVDYVKFLRLQVKVLSMSRLGGAGAVAQLVADVPTTSTEGEGSGMEGNNQVPAWEKWSNDGTEQQIARLMDEDIGAAMQLLQSKSLCIIPISLTSAIFPAHPPALPSDSTTVKPKSDHP